MVYAVEQSSVIFENSLFIFEPFVFDYFRASVEFAGLSFGLAPAGDYSQMSTLQKLKNQNLYWIAAPHHYDGASEQAIYSGLPKNIQDYLINYPNKVFNGKSLDQRQKAFHFHMKSAGMDYFIGEWGTITDLRNSDGSYGGYRKWIQDSLESIKKYSKGHLWWRYSQDDHHQEHYYYLLRNKSYDGRSLSPYEQVLKCSGDGLDLVKLVYSRCSI